MLAFEEVLEVRFKCFFPVKRSMVELNQEYWNKEYETNPDLGDYVHFVVERLVEKINPGSVLEVGCGSGGNLFI